MILYSDSTPTPDFAHLGLVSVSKLGNEPGHIVLNVIFYDPSKLNFAYSFKVSNLNFVVISVPTLNAQLKGTK